MERQVGRIPQDHLNRYLWAAKFARGPVLDAACGSGYGTEILKNATGDAMGVDIHPPTIEYAKEHYQDCKFVCGDVLGAPWKRGFQTVVSFETIEHLYAPMEVLSMFRMSCSGYFLCSVPNENLYPYDPEVFRNDEYPHLRHYTPEQFDSVLVNAGFRILSRWCQVSKAQPEVVRGTEGKYLVYCCE